jgi:hypothetical protein
MRYRHTARVQSLFREINGDFPTITQVSHAPYGLGQYTVRYYFLSGEEACYVGMAHRYRDFLATERGLTRNPQSPAFALELYGSIDIKANLFGITYNREIALTTYSQAITLLELLKSHGINDIALRYIGWDREGTFNNRVPTQATPARLLGGRRDFDALLAFLSDADIPYYLETDPVRFRSGGNGVNRRRDSVRSPHRIPALLHGYDLAFRVPQIWLDPYRLLSPTLLIPTATRFADNFNRLGATGISPGVITEIVYSDFSEGNGIFRSQTVGVYEEILSHYRDLGFSIAASGGNAYAVPFSERIFDAPIYSSLFDIFGWDVPFYQIVFQGWVTMTTPAMMQSIRPEITFLKAVETGMELLYTGIYEEPSTLLYTRFEHLFSSTATLWVERAAAQVARYAPLQRLVYNQEIIRHSYAAPEVPLTVFANGVHVLVNYTDDDVIYENRIVPALDFIWWREG